MSPLTATAKGNATRDLIVDRAYAMACAAGVEGLSIGPLAQAVGMSKSGVFAHFGSREELQLAVLDDAARRFGEHVFSTALRQPRGLPRLRAILAGWFDWVRQTSGGCVILGAATEFDDRPGPLRDRVIAHEVMWRGQLARAIGLAVETGELAADTDAAQLAFELNAIGLAVHHDAGLLGLEPTLARGQAAVERLIRACRA